MLALADADALAEAPALPDADAPALADALGLADAPALAEGLTLGDAAGLAEGAALALAPGDGLGEVPVTALTSRAPVASTANVETTVRATGSRTAGDGTSFGR